MQTTTRIMAALAIVALSVSCAGAQRTALVPTSRVPAAKGVVETKRTDNQNTEVALEVQHLAPPQRVANGTSVYVVWVKPSAPEAPPQNVGAIVVGEDRRASLTTKTPHANFDL